MKFCKIGNITQWQSYDGSDIILPTGRAQMRILSNGKFSAYFGDQMVAAGNCEMVNLSLSTEGGVLTITAEKGSNVMISIEQGSGSLTGSNPEENFVSLEPKKDYSPEIYRMELAMRQNQMQMQALLASERARVDALMAEKAEAATPLAEKEETDVIEPENEA